MNGSERRTGESVFQAPSSREMTGVLVDLKSIKSRQRETICQPHSQTVFLVLIIEALKVIFSAESNLSLFQASRGT